MDASKKFLETNDIIPFLSFGDGEAHTVTIFKDKEDQMENTQGDKAGEMIDGVSYLVEEGGVKKSFFTASVTLIGKLSEKKAGDIVTIQQTKTKGSKGFRTGYTVEDGEVKIEKAKEGEQEKSLKESVGENPNF
jgi:hypothetical protein|tara:strand:- start:60 stop:461 length:402 start_codon:yes stop_codon:yes gene_type:complete